MLIIIRTLCIRFSRNTSKILRILQVKSPCERETSTSIFHSTQFRSSKRIEIDTLHSCAAKWKIGLFEWEIHQFITIIINLRWVLGRYIFCGFSGSLRCPLFFSWESVLAQAANRCEIAIFWHFFQPGARNIDFFVLVNFKIWTFVLTNGVFRFRKSSTNGAHW